MKKCLYFCTVTFFLATVGPSVAEIVDGPNGPVEFIGLESWTASKLLEARPRSIARSGTPRLCRCDEK